MKTNIGQVQMPQPEKPAEARFRSQQQQFDRPLVVHRHMSPVCRSSSSPDYS